MSVVKAVVSAGLVVMACAVTPARADAEDVRGVIVRTLLLSEDSRLIGDVTCNVTGGPCIAFGAPNITLNLNGFSITGPSDPATGCKGTSVGTDTGISSNGQVNAGIRGPGVVQRFRQTEFCSSRASYGWVQGVTTTTNCMSGFASIPRHRRSA